MEVIELAKEKPKPEFNFKEARAAGKYIFETEELVIGYDEPLSKPLAFAMEPVSYTHLRGQRGRSVLHGGLCGSGRGPA